MPKPINYRPEQVPEFGLRGGTNTVFQQKAQNLAGLNAVAQELTDPIAEGILGAEAEADRLVKYEATKDLPIEEIPPAEGGFNPFSLTKWGRTYDKSYNELDKQLIGYKAQEALTENALLAGRPENGPGATRRYAEESDKIIKAYVDAAEPANRNDLMVKLTHDARMKEFQLAEAEASRGRAQIKSQLDMTVNGLGQRLSQAGLDDDPLAIAQAANELERNVTSQVNLGFMTPAEGQAAKETIGSKTRQQYTVGQWVTFESQGKGDEFLADLVTNPHKYQLNLQEAQGAAKTILQTKEFRERATADHYTMQGLQVDNDMARGIIESPQDLVNYDLTDKQVLQYSTAIEKSNRVNAQKQVKFDRARIDIENNQAAGIDKATINTMTTEAWGATEAELGRPLSLLEQADSITGGEGAYPASGVPGLSLKTNVPVFDRKVSAALTSQDPQAMFNGYQVYQTMVVNKGQPNTLNLDDDALRSAVMMTSLINSGANPQVAAQRTVDTVLKRNEQGTKIRLNEFDLKRNMDKLPGGFKNATGANSDMNSQVFGDYVNQTRANYAAGLTIDDAMEATNNNFKRYKESKYFAPGKVGQLAPEEELPILAYEFDNQLAIAVQDIINNGGEGAGTTIEWASASDAIDLSALKPEELVEMPLSAVNDGKHFLSEGFSTKLPKIRVGNHESEVYLIAGDRVRFGDNGRPLYQLGYIDKNGILQPITDGRGPNQAATFSPKDINELAPKYYDKFTKGERIKQIKEAAKRPYSEILGQIGSMKNPSPQSLLELQDAYSKMSKSEKDMLRAVGLDGEDL